MVPAAGEPGPDRVADATNGVDETGSSAEVEFVPQSLDERVDRVAFDIAAGSPHAIHERLPRHDAPGVTHQALEERKLRSRERDRLGGARHGVRAGINHEVGDLDA